MDRLPADLLLRHGRVITMDAHRRLLADGSIAIRDGRIVAVGPDHEVAPSVIATAIRDVRGGTVHPGLIDAHTHTGSDLIRGFAPKASREWGPLEGSFYESFEAEADYLGALQSSMEMAANGITLYCDTGGSVSLEQTAQAIDTVGIRGIPGYRIFDIQVEEDLVSLVTSTQECLARLRRQLEMYPFGAGRVMCAVTLAGMGLNSDELLVEAQALAAERGVPMVMHQSWSADEVRQASEAYGTSPIGHLADLGLLGPNLTLVHMIQLADAEVDLVAGSGTRVVHCPNASMRRAMGAIRVGRFPELVARGTTVALGSDGLSGKRDLLRQAYLAAVGFREFRDEMPVLTAETALEMATINGARALNLDAELGSIEAGKRADMVIHTTDRPEAHPRFSDPVDNLVYYAQSSTIDTVLVDGEAIFERGRFTRFDPQEAYRQIDAAAAQFEQKLGRAAFSAWPIVS